jgi:hypothetical protein
VGIWKPFEALSEILEKTLQYPDKNIGWNWVTGKKKTMIKIEFSGSKLRYNIINLKINELLKKCLILITLLEEFRGLLFQYSLYLKK